MADPRRLNAAVYGCLAIACAISVWPLLFSQTIPAFQQDWTWPLSRPLSLVWLHAFAGLWDERSLGQGNPLPWQTYAVAVQVASILLFGPASGLALWLGALEFAAGAACARMLAAFGVRSHAARGVAALAYALGPVVFTRIAAGHLSYLLAYALLPAIVVLAKRTIERPQLSAAAALGLVAGLAASQIQFYAIAALAVVPLPLLVTRAPRWVWRLTLAAFVAVAVQLQALLPLLYSSAPALYFAQRALLSWEYNNSSPAADAPIMLGYFTRYYESHALPGAWIVLYVLLVSALLLAIVARRRFGLYALALAALGAALSAGLYGPLGAVLAWLFERVVYFTVFRDLHYFAVLIALAMSLAIAFAIQWRRALAIPYALLVAAVVFPTVAGSDLRELLVPREYVADTLADMQAAANRGLGRVLWLPAEEPVGPIGASNQGRDFTAYGPPGNPSVSDDYQNPALAYALATLRAGRPDWQALAAMNVRYVVARTYLRSGRANNFGTGYPLAFDGLSDAALAGLLSRDRRLHLLRSTPYSSLYELSGALPLARVANAREDAMLYPELAPGEVALAPSDPATLGANASALTADPRLDWVSGTFGWRYLPWMPQSIYPFVWTISARPLALTIPARAQCIVAAAPARAATLLARGARYGIAGSWKRYRIGEGAGSAAAVLAPHGGVAAIVNLACPPQHGGAAAQAYVMASGYDAGWRSVRAGKLVKPGIADGWMMAWDAGAGARPLIYLPAILQIAGLLIGLLIVAATRSIAARTDDAAAALDRPIRR